MAHSAEAKRHSPSPARAMSLRRMLLRWHQANRRDFPWRRNRTPYRVLISEVLLQRTQAVQVVPVFRSILRDYPTPARLARADLRSLRLSLRSLGLTGRAGRIRDMARQIMRAHRGRVPARREKLLGLLGVGPYAAGAVLCFAFGGDEPIVDANVARVLKRVYGIRLARPRPHTDSTFWDLARGLLPEGRSADFNYALLDLAALVCRPRHPLCPECPLRVLCAWAAEDGDRGTTT